MCGSALPHIVFRPSFAISYSTVHNTSHGPLFYEVGGLLEKKEEKEEEEEAG